MTLDPKVQRILDRHRMLMAAKPAAFRAATEQRAAGIREELANLGATDLVQAALGWRWAVGCVVTQYRVLGLPVPLQVAEVLDNMLAAGMQIVDDEDRKAPKLIVPGEDL